jgi:aryl-alcohol dehydrogenase-like predicted oxidoreductase
LNQDINKLRLGATDILVSPMGVGAWSWGDRFFWGYGQEYSEEDVKAAIEVSLAEGINFFDTAEVYGRGHSELLVGKYLAKSSQSPVIATKAFPYPWRIHKSQVVRALRGSLRRLDAPLVDLYQVHWPYSLMSVENWAEGLADAVQQGLTRAIGVSNYNRVQMRRSHGALSRRGLPLASNQVVYSLLNRRVEKNGLLNMCRDLEVSLIAYSPLAQGLLTGKYTSSRPMQGVRARRYSARLTNQVQPLVQLMREIGQEHGGKTPSQVALNWVMCKGAIPIPGAKNLAQAQENAGALGWSLSADEVARLDQASDRVNEGI